MISMNELEPGLFTLLLVVVMALAFGAVMLLRIAHALEILAGAALARRASVMPFATVGRIDREAH